MTKNTYKSIISVWCCEKMLKIIRTTGFNYDNVILQWTRGFYITGDDNMNQSVFSKIMQAAQDGKRHFLSHLEK